jgi:general secretion pathway protein J
MTMFPLSLQSPARKKIPQKVGGFTLLELLISMTLLLLIVVILGGAFRLGFRSLDAGEKRIEAIERFRTSVGIITDQLQSAVPLTYDEDGTKNSYFKGNAETLRFASGYSIWGENQGTVIVSYRLEYGDDGRWALYAAERGIGIGMEEIREIKLFDKVKRFSFSYFGKDVAEEKGRWKTEWTDDTTTPEQVQITFERDQREETLLVSLYARIVTQPI